MNEGQVSGSGSDTLNDHIWVLAVASYSWVRRLTPERKSCRSAAAQKQTL